jgi:hypothetical protein
MSYNRLEDFRQYVAESELTSEHENVHCTGTLYTGCFNY